MSSPFQHLLGRLYRYPNITCVSEFPFFTNPGEHLKKVQTNSWFSYEYELICLKKNINFPSRKISSIVLSLNSGKRNKVHTVVFSPPTRYRDRTVLLLFFFLQRTQGNKIDLFSINPWNSKTAIWFLNSNLRITAHTAIISLFLPSAVKKQSGEHSPPQKGNFRLPIQ